MDESVCFCGCSARGRREESNCFFLFNRVLRAIKSKRRSSFQNGKSREIDTVIRSRFGTDIPADIFTDIALRLPVKSILVCRCVCKTWRQIISDPEFTELYSKRMQQSVILQSNEQSHDSRTLYLLEPQNYSVRDTCLDEFCSKEQSGMNLDTKLKIPLRDHKLTLSGRLEALAKAHSKGRIKGKCLIATRPLNDNYCIEKDKYDIANSCNGLLCLCEPEGNNPVVVCNPVTGEYTLLMGSIIFIDPCQLIIGGLGFCPSTNEYKVVRIYINYDRMVAEVQTLGSGSWKEVTIGYAPKSYRGLKYPSYMSGKLHWLSGSDEIFLFDMENHQFGSVALPIWDPTKRRAHNDTTMGVLRNQICICQIYYPHQQIVIIWLMNDNGGTSTWELVCSIDNEDRWPYTGLFYPMKLYENGALLIFHSSGGLIYHDPKECGLKYFRIQGNDPYFEAIAYLPSFISLEKQIIGDDVVVQNVI